ncbi:MAG: DUF1858 domain-containing protein [Clostridiaceae bacterium]|nr:DUF1858 domain-containing protein [Clostridiaceae bacterium]
MKKVTPDMKISEILKLDRGLVPIFLNNGLYCLGCPSAIGESLKDACEVHGLDCEKLVNELNAYLEKNQ